MQCIKLRAKRWGKLNLVYNTKEKTFEGKRKHGMTGQTISQTSIPDPTQDLKRTNRELENMLKMILKEE
jgi:hypothetical protein